MPHWRLTQFVVRLEDNVSSSKIIYHSIWNYASWQHNWLHSWLTNRKRSEEFGSLRIQMTSSARRYGAHIPWLGKHQKVCEPINDPNMPLHNACGCNILPEISNTVTEKISAEK